MRRIVAVLIFAATTTNAQTIAITGGTVFPVSGPRIEGGTVVIKDGKVVAVGRGIAIPAGAERVDATGKWVTPGLVNASTSLGLSESGDPQFSGGYNDTRATGPKESRRPSPSGKESIPRRRSSCPRVRMESRAWSSGHRAGSSAARPRSSISRATM